MRKPIVWAGLALLVILAGGALLWNLAPKKASSSLAFELKDAEGKTHRLADLRGQATLVHFWASWCPPCIDELPDFLEMVKAADSTKVHFVAITLDKNWDDAHKILPTKDLPKNLISVIDPDAKSADAFGSYNYPETYALDRDHQVIEKFVGPRPWNSEEFKNLAINLQNYQKQ